jgi:hypothetical protein
LISVVDGRKYTEALLWQQARNNAVAIKGCCYGESLLIIKTTGKTPAKVTATILAALEENRKH